MYNLSNLYQTIALYTDFVYLQNCHFSLSALASSVQEEEIPVGNRDEDERLKYAAQLKNEGKGQVKYI